MSDFDFSLDQQTADTLNEGINLGGGTRLPFEVPYIFCQNGDKRMSALASVMPAMYFGGWATSREDADSAMQTWDPPQTSIPTYWGTNNDYATSDGKAMPAYMSRSMICALIGQRVSWVIKDASGQTHRFKDYQTGTKRHGQFLVYLADRLPDKTFVPWGPAVLTVSGYQVGNLLQAFADHKSNIEKALKANKIATPPWVFYGAYGTFGDQINQKMVGPSGKQSPITPLGCQTIKDITREILQKLFVGKELAAEMAEIKREAKDWLTAWDNLGATTAPVAQSAPQQSQGDSYWENLQPPDAAEEDIPF